MTRELLANGAAAISILTVLFAAPLLLGSYTVVQRAGVIVQFAWFSSVLALLVAAFVAGLLGLILLG